MLLAGCKLSQRRHFEQVWAVSGCRVGSETGLVPFHGLALLYVVAGS